MGRCGRSKSRFAFPELDQTDWVCYGNVALTEMISTTFFKACLTLETCSGGVGSGCAIRADPNLLFHLLNSIRCIGFVTGMEHLPG